MRAVTGVSSTPTITASFTGVRTEARHKDQRQQHLRHGHRHIGQAHEDVVHQPAGERRAQPPDESKNHRHKRRRLRRYRWWSGQQT
jgi:hypothetical protein